jgi:hypothetical protein
MLITLNVPQMGQVSTGQLICSYFSEGATAWRSRSTARNATHGAMRASGWRYRIGPRPRTHRAAGWRPRRDQPPIIAPLPPRLIAGGYASVGLVCDVAVKKYQDHLPLYRQEQILKMRYLLTNYHVVKGAKDLIVVTEDEQHLKARIEAMWPKMDLALLSVTGAAFAVIPLGDSDAVAIGESVVAIGTPEDPALAQSITQGIISGRRLFGEIPCFQTSVLINHGNSGGPLVDEQGKAVGITSAGLGTLFQTEEGESVGSGTQGINFAIEINIARNFLTQQGIAL